MKISQIGEDPFIQMIKEKMSNNLPAGIVGIGDDCAVIPLNNEKALLLSTDSLVEGCHFLKDKISSPDLGYKSVMVNASDIAAMGGKALYILMSIALPQDIEESWLNGYLKGIHEACSELNICLVGGDTTGSKNEIFINITIVGEVDKENIKYRKNAQVGDLICLTSPIGDSLAGFHSLMEGKINTLIKKHNRPKAQFKEGIWLGRHPAVHAMMDLSDGLYIDLARMMQASGVGAEVVLEQIPLSKDFLEFCQTHNWKASEQAIVSGEEYCLLFTVNETDFEQLNKDFISEFSYSLSVIGTVKTDNKVIYKQNDQLIQIQSKPYFHFNER